MLSVSCKAKVDDGTGCKMAIFDGAAALALLNLPIKDLAHLVDLLGPAGTLEYHREQGFGTSALISSDGSDVLLEWDDRLRSLEHGCRVFLVAQPMIPSLFKRLLPRLLRAPAGPVDGDDFLSTHVTLGSADYLAAGRPLGAMHVQACFRELPAQVMAAKLLAQLVGPEPEHF